MAANTSPPCTELNLVHITAAFTKGTRRDTKFSLMFALLVKGMEVAGARGVNFKDGHVCKVPACMRNKGRLVVVRLTNQGGINAATTGSGVNKGTIHAPTSGNLQSHRT